MWHFGPTESTRARAMQAQACEIEPKEGQSIFRRVQRSCSTVRTDPAGLETLDSGRTMLETCCGKRERS
jgi:hypothetical protein